MKADAREVLLLAYAGVRVYGESGSKQLGKGLGTILAGFYNVCVYNKISSAFRSLRKIVNLPGPVISDGA